VRYKGKIGEFKVAGFILSMGLCLGFALFIYSRLTFVTVPPQQEVKTVDEGLKKIEKLEMQVSDLKAKLCELQKQLPPVQKPFPKK